MKWLAAILMLAGLAVLASDALAEGGFRLTALGEWWFWVHAGSLQVLQPAIERHLSRDLWDVAVQPLLETSLAAILLVLAAAAFGLSLVLRRRG